jgi:hypothetical protein
MTGFVPTTNLDTALDRIIGYETSRIHEAL